ncbi:cyclase family protein [Desulfomonile tiedjei]|uniref:Kynurenine formamidase n=1 Tax=Desulfomonile tiedjei (strain ATCC 49306 / DSM 6799 / DCB-1) TaxID=706587 RepID=I4CA79_DESTA|nr:cyclase family protein [Desulfomonile tiedjei]AFM26470.1 putative metal-dependent hydrolase [Desulfomonile tiedjei DSM 6799]
MPLYDATLALHEKMAIFPGDPPFKMTPLFQTTMGDKFNLSTITMGTHTGTHVDPPAHYLNWGYTVDEIPLETLIGPGKILDLTGHPELNRDVLHSCDLKGVARVFFKTDNSRKLLEPDFHENYVSLTKDGASYLSESGIRMVGTDYFSIETYHSSAAEVHHILLQAGILVVESLNLGHIPAGPCTIYCLPLKILGADGAPARVLIEMD